MTFGSTGTASPGVPAAEPAAIAAGKDDPLCGDAHWPPADGSCLRALMIRSGRPASVRVVGTGASVVERAMTDRERIEAVFAAAAAPRPAVASRDRSGVAR